MACEPRILPFLNYIKGRTTANPAPVQPDEEVTPKKAKAEQLAAAVCVSVISNLGRPRNLFKVAAIRLWENRYRVNVQTGSDAVSIQIAHSFFVSADDKGNIVESIPPISKLY